MARVSRVARVARVVPRARLRDGRAEVGDQVGTAGGQHQGGGARPGSAAPARARPSSRPRRRGTDPTSPGVRGGAGVGAVRRVVGRLGVRRRRVGRLRAIHRCACRRGGVRPRRVTRRSEGGTGGQQGDSCGTRQRCPEARTGGSRAQLVAPSQGRMETSAMEVSDGEVLASELAGRCRCAEGVHEAVDPGGGHDRARGRHPPTTGTGLSRPHAHLTPSAPPGSKMSRRHHARSACGSTCRLRLRRPRCAAERTAPGRLPRTAPADFASRAHHDPQHDRLSLVAGAAAGGRLPSTCRAAPRPPPRRRCGRRGRGRSGR